MTWNFRGQFYSIEQSIIGQRLKLKSNNCYIAALRSGCRNDRIMLGNNSHIQKQQENIGEGNSYFPKYIISILQSSVDTVGKLELTGWRFIV